MVSTIARSVRKLVIRVAVLVGWCNTYKCRKVSRVAMCEVRSKKNGQEQKKKKKVQWSATKRNRL
jgi:hypothetical protein